MSLFANIFKPARGKAENSKLFSDNNKFRARDDAALTAPLPKPDKKAATAAKRKGDSSTAKKDATTGAKAAKKQKSAVAETKKVVKTAVKTKPKSEAARKQAEKVKGLASAARRIERADSDSETDSDSDVSREDSDEDLDRIANSEDEEEVDGDVEDGDASSGEEEEEDEEEKQDQGKAGSKHNINDPKVLARTIFVGNIPAKAKKKALTNLFQEYGPVESLRLRSVPLKKDVILPRKAAVASGAVDPTRGSAHAYIIFTNVESAQNAVKNHNMKEWLGQHLRVDIAATASVKSSTGADKAEKSADVRYDPARSVFIGNLHLEATDEELIRFFINGVGAGGENDLEAVRIVRDAHTSIGKGIAYALFKTSAGRRAAIGLNGRKLRERPLRITSINTSKSPGRIGGGGTSSRAAGKSTTSPGSAGGGKFKSERGAAPWQGVTATQSGRSRGPAGGKPLTKFGGKGGGGGLGGGKNSATRKGGKRPSVMARKQKQLGLPVTAGVKNKHRPSMGGSGPSSRN